MNWVEEAGFGTLESLGVRFESLGKGETSESVDGCGMRRHGLLDRLKALELRVRLEGLLV